MEYTSELHSKSMRYTINATSNYKPFVRTYFPYFLSNLSAHPVFYLPE